MNGARKPKRLSDESLITWWCGGETKILTPRTIAHLFSSLWRLSGGKNRLSLGPKGPPHQMSGSEGNFLDLSTDGGSSL